MSRHDEISSVIARHLQRCIALATKGRRTVAAHPMVGCVIVKDGRIVGQGFHAAFGAAHAEIEALRKAGASARGADLYVNLEPCNHTGKTPPCTEAIIRAGIKRVIFGMNDVNKNVKGGGAVRLRKAGIEVIGPALVSASKQLNEVYVKNCETGLPFVTMKIAQSIDGFIALADGSSSWITNPLSRSYVQRLRVHVDAILIGAETLRMDNPKLLHGWKSAREQYRIVLSRSLRLPKKTTLFTDEYRSRTIVLSSAASIRRNAKNISSLVKNSVEIVPVRARKDGWIDPVEALKYLFERGIYSLMIEGGSEVFSQFMEVGLVDKVELFIAPKLFGDGIPAFPLHPIMNLESAKEFRLDAQKVFGDDILLTYYPVKK